MPLLLDLTGECFDRLTVKKRVGTLSPVTWACECECGKEVQVKSGNLTSGNTTSCGCKWGEEKLNHGHNLKGNRSGTYNSWVSMRTRCYNKKCKAYPNYGGRGIRVTPRWQHFSLFLLDMGIKPKGYSIERENVNGNYERGNCRWIPREEQNLNKRNSKKNK